MIGQDLFEVLYIILDKKKVTAVELASHFAVSTRTIYRWVEQLCVAGIPLYMTKGRGGGISVSDGFVLDQALFSDKEKKQVLYALDSLQTAQRFSGKTDDGDFEKARTKLKSVFKTDTAEWIEIDFSSWNNCEQSAKTFELIKTAILERHPVLFDYFGSNGQMSTRVVEPWRLVFKEQAWYMLGYCLLRHDERFFKMSRIRNISMKKESCIMPFKKGRVFDGEGPSIEKYLTIKARVESTLYFRVLDEFPGDVMEKQKDGSIIVTFRLPDENWIYSYLLSFGEHMEVLEPECVRQKIQESLIKAAGKYLHTK
ncbi:MAG: YafY family transcriptional regulator [Spirochaetaceae bacterium]|nr:YafY family transcriptional regulator [Spirochaetaceae bacterium]